MFGAKALATKLADGLDVAANDFEKSGKELALKFINRPEQEGRDRDVEAALMQAHGYVISCMTLRAVAAVVRSVVE